MDPDGTVRSLGIHCLSVVHSGKLAIVGGERIIGGDNPRLILYPKRICWADELNPFRCAGEVDEATAKEIFAIAIDALEDRGEAYEIKTNSPSP